MNKYLEQQVSCGALNVVAPVLFWFFGLFFAVCEYIVHAFCD